MTIAPYTFTQGRAPLLISIPHVGTHIPAEIAAHMTEEALRTPDTDWHLDRLYAFAAEFGASVLCATHSRYVVDLNRPPDNANLYPGHNTTGLCPIDTFDSQPIYLGGLSPNAEEIERRRTLYWQPYHDRLASELQRLLSGHKNIVLWDAHSIRSVVPRFFEGTLPALNFGTADGASCAVSFSDAVMQCAKQDARYSHVLNGRFKGGYITRQYGAPANGVHAIQLEMTQNTYMRETFPYEFDAIPAAQIDSLLKQIIQKTIEFARG
jgi:N-formylglutamate deformylase